MSINLEFLEIALGHRLVKANRIFFEIQGQLDKSVGALELEFDNCCLYLHGASDGETLLVDNKSWQDPFKEPLSPENHAFIKKYGKYAKISTNSFEIMGKVLTQFCLIQNQFGTIAGLELVFENSSIVFLVDCDEYYVMSKEDQRLNDWGLDFLETKRRYAV